MLASVPWVQGTWVGGSHTFLAKLRMLTICFAFYLLPQPTPPTFRRNQNSRGNKKNSRKTKFHVLELDFGEKNSHF